MVLSFVTVRALVSAMSEFCLLWSCLCREACHLKYFSRKVGGLVIIITFGDGIPCLGIGGLWSTSIDKPARKSWNTLWSYMKEERETKIKELGALIWGVILEPGESGTGRRLAGFRTDEQQLGTKGCKSWKGRTWTRARERKVKAWWLKSERPVEECYYGGWWRVIFWASGIRKADIA